MNPDELTLRDLRVQVLAERRDGRLVKLPAHFHERLARLEQGLEQARDAAREDEQRFQRANSDISKLSDLKLELHKHRERKLTRLAREKVNGQLIVSRVDELTITLDDVWAQAGAVYVYADDYLAGRETGEPGQRFAAHHVASSTSQ